MGLIELIAQVLSMKPEDELYDAKVTVLGEYIDHHVMEEREEMFPKARKCGTTSVSSRLKARLSSALRFGSSL